MLLAVDVGNTQTHLGAFDGDELVEHWRFATRADATADELAVRRRRRCSRSAASSSATVDGSIVSSVVPQLTPGVRRGCASATCGASCLIVGPGVKTGMPIQLDNPLELGADRLVNAVAAYERFSAAPAPSSTSAPRSRSTWSRRPASTWAA